MKQFLKNSVFVFLMFLVRVRLKRLRPFIIGVTGSVGKTSTKDAIYTILKTRYSILRNEKSYNTEFGLPLAILEQSSGFSSAFQWVGILLKATWKAFFGGHGLQLMVLEMGVDKPGDMDVLLKMVRPQIAVMTAIKPVHIAPGQFKDLDDIFLEKSKLVFSLQEKGIAIFNLDDPYLSPLSSTLTCRQLTYGASEQAQLRVHEVVSSGFGVRFTATYGDQIVTKELPLPGKFQIYVILPAIAVALTQGFTLEEACRALENYRLPPGRMNILEGINDTIILDSSYNASPETMKEALGVLQELAPAAEQSVHSKHKNPVHTRRRIAVLGSMNELGNMGEHYHREIGRHVLGHTDMMITVGEEASWISDEARKTGFPPEASFHFPHVEEAIAHLHAHLQKNDMILVKGSQNNVRLEKLVKALMKNPALASELLVRQEKNWKH